MPFNEGAFCATHWGKVPCVSAFNRKSQETWGTSYDRRPKNDGLPGVNRLRVPSGLAPSIQICCHATMYVLTINATVSPGLASNTNVVHACSLVAGSTDIRAGICPP